MLSWTTSLSLPLLAKELVEQAARKRTYAVRALYAALLFGAFALEVKNLTEGRSAEEVLGSGERLFDRLMGWQVAGILAFLPAMTAGALAAEREQGTMDLLRLTGLTPREILLQKYLGRLVPILTFQFLAIPLAALAYALGGVSDDRLLGGAAALILVCVQVGALSLWAAAKSPTTLRALIRAYVACLVLYGIFPFFTPLWCLSMRVPSPWVLVLSLVSAGLSLLFLRWSRLSFVAALHRPPPRPAASLKEWWRRTRGWLQDAFGEPLFWSDVSSKRRRRGFAPGEILGKGVGCISAALKLAVLFAFPVMIFLTIGLTILGEMGAAGYGTVVLGSWGLAAAVVAALAAGTVSGERSRQTLDVLLTTPMPGREIAERMTGSARRAALWAAVPLFLAQAVLPHFLYDKPRFVMGGPMQMLGTAAAVAIYLPTAVWIAFGVGCRVKHRLRAVLFAFGSVALWAAGTMWLSNLVARYEGYETLHASHQDFFPSGTSAVVALLSPMAGIVCMIREIGTLGPWTQELFLVLHFVLMTAVYFAVRRLCLRRAGVWLGRA